MTSPTDPTAVALHAHSASPDPEYLRRYQVARTATLALTQDLTAEDQVAQSMADASPTKWHLAHTTWFFETFLLTPHLAGYEPFDPQFGYLFNSYYEALGPRQPRPSRGLITRPSLDQVLGYRAHVDAAMAELLVHGAGDFCDLLDLGLAHEEQHQELILMDILHLFAQSPLKPAYAPPPRLLASEPETMEFVEVAGGLVEIGHDGQGFAFDNEQPRHKVFLEPYRLAERLVTNGDWLAFMADDGYSRPEFWLSDGYARAQAEGWRAPLYWEEGEAGWQAMTLYGLRPVDPAAPVVHVSFYEVEAFAAWAGARLPTEAEWEHAAERLPVRGSFLGWGSLEPAGAPRGRGLRQMYGDVWEWTRSAYEPYPGFQAAPGAVGEYNGKFMSGQYVLRGGACVTPDGHVRPSYRNFFQPHQRWMFAGLRLAQDADRKVAPAPKGPRRTFARDVLEGLSRSQKQIPPKYFYDAEGSRLFEAICELPEYYPTRTEVALLRDIAPQLADMIPQGAALVEFGSGASLKTRLVLDAARHVGLYVPVEISAAALDAAGRAISEAYPDLKVAPLQDDFTAAITLPKVAQGLPHVGFFPGSTIGNFTPPEAVELMASARRLLGQGALFVVGIDMVKPEAQLLAAYDDAQGVTAAFNRNLLVRINRELGGDFDIEGFAHRAVWNRLESRIEMHLESLRDQRASVAGRSFDFPAGQTIHTENSYKFSLDGFSSLANLAGWRVERHWLSPEPAFGLVALKS